MKKVAVITGASKGLGKALSDVFKKKGYTVIGISRTHSENADMSIQADLSDSKGVEKAVEEINRRTDRIDVLINNAGVGLYESWEEMSMEDLRRLFEINFFSVVNLTKLLLPQIKKSRGSIINVSSVAGKLYVPYMGGYCASKYALNAFSDSLRAELIEDNVHVLNLIVGRINTGFSSRAMGSRKPPETPFGSTPEKFAEAVFKAYKNRKREIVFPRWYKYFIWLSKLFPGLYDRKAYEKWHY